MNSVPIIPDHTLLRPIGRGSYGEVWLARNIMGAWRAVKVIERRQFDSDRPYEREFAGIQNYEPVSRSADGLVHVLHVGRNDAEAYFYYVMELADAAGEGINEAAINNSTGASSRPPVPLLISDYSPHTLRSDLQRQTRLPTADCLSLALDVVGGLARLHRQGLVHRDVKPGNIIFVDGRAKLADLGLVSAGGEGRTFVGTEGYIAPEGPGTPAADLYALGLVLYEASTGFTPEKFPDVPPEWLGEKNFGEALELHEVILKAGEGQRRHRYQSAEEMRADLALLQSGQSIRRVRTLERGVQRLRRWGLAAGLAVCAAIIGTAFSHWRAEVAEKMRAQETLLRRRAETAERDSRERLHAAYTAEARMTVQTHDTGRRYLALEAVRQAAAIRVTPELRQTALIAMALPDLRVERELDLGPTTTGLAFDPDFTRYAVARGRGAVELYSLAATGLLFRLPAATNLEARVPQFSPDGRYLGFKRDHPGGAGTDADLEVWDLDTTQRVLFAEHGVSRIPFSFHPSQSCVLMGRPDGTLVEWDFENHTTVSEWHLPGLQLASLAPDGRRLAVAFSTRTNWVVQVRDVSDKSRRTETFFPGRIYGLHWHPSGRTLAAASDDGSVTLVNATDGASHPIGWHKRQAVGVTFTPQGDFLVSRGWDNEINVWNTRTARPEMSFPINATSFEMDRQGRKIGVLADMRRLVLLDFNPADERRELEVPPAGLAMVRAGFSPDLRWLVAKAPDGMTVWNLYQPGPPMRVPSEGIQVLGFSPDSSELFAWAGRKHFRWRLIPATDLSAPTLEAQPVSISLESIFNGALPNLPPVWTEGRAGVRTMRLTNAVSGTSYALSGADYEGAVSSDGQWLARRMPGSTVLMVTSLTNRQPPLRLTNSSRVRFQAFSPDSASLAVLTDYELKVMDTRTWAVRSSRAAERSSLGSVLYSPDGRLLVCVESTHTAALLNPRTLEPLLPLPAWTHPLAISADNHWLVTSVEGRRVQQWDLAAVRAQFRKLGIDWAE